MIKSDKTDEIDSE
jgi:hypothetical protein